jgi:sulfate adenylyltransferase subunit 1 (EFTu-like GTPase family)
VAYRYFATPRRKFIVADTPATSSTPATWSPALPGPTAAVILIDAEKGVLPQTGGTPA